MADNEDDNDFSDGDFDNLADSTIKELEEKAILSTQGNQQPGSFRLDTKLEPRNVNVARNGLRNIAARPESHNQFESTFPLPQYHLGNDCDDDNFEWIEDDGVPTPVEERKSFMPAQQPPGEMTQREQWRQNRFGQPKATSDVLGGHNLDQRSTDNMRVDHKSPNHIHQHLVVAKEFSEVNTPLRNYITQDQTQRDEALQARIKELMGERDDLKKTLHQARLDVETKQGEIAVIRASKIKESRVFDRQISSLKRAIQEESEKHEANLRSMTNESKKIVSENRYLQHELTEEAEKIKFLQQQMKEKASIKSEGASITTPKKAPANSLRDGFDDDEMMVVSPSKTARRSKPSTPTGIGKRKRKADFQSPVRPLVLRQSGLAVEEGSKDVQPLKAEGENFSLVTRKDFQAERNLKFIQQILNYHIHETGKPLVEVLMQFSFPGEKPRSFSTILLEGSAKLKGKRLQAELLQIFIELWSKALKEKYFKCIAILVEVVEYMIDMQMSIVDKGTITILLPLLQDSVTINAAKRFKYSPVNHVAFGQFRQTPQSVLNHEVDGTRCLGLLYKIACIVEDEASLIEHFWRSMSTDFVLMMLNVWQPTTDITNMIRLLKTSIFPSTFGNICPEDEQARMETYIIERVSYLLWETPKVDEGLKPYTQTDICKFRLEVMTLLNVVAIGSSQPPHSDAEYHGSKLIAHHQSAIARIVRSLYDEVNAMYMMTSSHELHAELVNRGVRLLHHLLQVHGADINMPEKLSAVNGGVHKHRVVLSRLAFSEGFYVDRLITNETAAMAINMLEESVTPDEADQLLEVFPHFKGRNASEE